MLLRTITKFLTGLKAAAPFSDGELLQRFLVQRDQAAFEVLVRRHGPMVMRVCQRVLPSRQDAEDAFQATFVVLARKGSVVGHDSVASWLHGVAYRIALKARTAAARRGVHERQAGTMASGNRQDGPVAGLDQQELRALLDQELQHLPEKYREPLILCYLEGKTNQEAAQQLGWPMGTVATRLASGRDLLRNRLARRGLALALGTLGTLLAEEAAPAAALSATLVAPTVEGAMLVAAGQAAGPLLTPQAVILAEAAVKTMAAAKLRGACLVILVGLASASVVAYLIVSNRPGVTVVAATKATTPVALLGHVGPVDCVALTPDGTTIASGSEDGTVKIWDRQSGKVQQSLNIGEPVFALAIAPDGKLLAAGCDRSVQVWDLPAPRQRLTLDHPAPVNSLAFAPDNETLAVGTGRLGSRPLNDKEENGVHVWNALTGEKKSIQAAKKRSSISVSFSPQGRLNALSPDTIMPNNPEQRKIFDTIGFCCLVIARNGNDVAWTISQPDEKRGHIVFMGERSSGRLGQAIFGPSPDPVRVLAFSSDNKLLAAANTQVKVWDVATGQTRNRLAPGKSVVRSLVFAPDGKLLVLALANDVQVWDLSTGLLVRTLKGVAPDAR